MVFIQEVPNTQLGPGACLCLAEATGRSGIPVNQSLPGLPQGLEMYSLVFYCYSSE